GSGTLVQWLSAVWSGDFWSVTPSTGLADGQYSAQAAQSDGAGNTGTSGVNKFVVDTAAPSVTITAPANGSTVSDSTPAFAGTAGAAAAGTTSADSSTVSVFVCSGSQASCNAGSGTLVQTLSATRSGTSWSVTPSTGLADGQYSAQAAQSDGAGNTGTSGVNKFVVDTAAPSVTITAPANGSTVSDSTPAFAGTAGAAAAGTTSADSS